MPPVAKQTNKPAAPKKGGSVIDRISDMPDFDDKLNISIYGESGSGKTTFWGTFPGKILVIIASGSEQAGELRSLDTPEYRKKIKQVMVESSLEIATLTDYATNNPKEFSTVVLDHATGLQEIVLREILGLSQAPVQLSWGTATREQWGQIGMHVKENLRRVFSCPQHSVVIAQQKEFNTSDEAKAEGLLPFVSSALTPSAAGWLNAAADYIVQTYKRPKVENVVTNISGKNVTTLRKTGKMEYAMRVAPHEIFATKFRVPKGHPLPDDIVDPSFDKLMAIIKGKK